MSKVTSFDQRVCQFLDSEISADQFELLSKQIENDPELRARFFKLAALDFAISQSADHRERQNNIEAMLRQAAPAPEEDSLLELCKALEAQREQHDDASLRWRDAPSLVGYLAGQAITDPRVVKVLVAASLLIGVLIYISLAWMDGDPDPNAIASESDQVQEPFDPAGRAVVAALTAERDTVWDQTPGTNVYEGQQITLTQGLAEITTARGAVVILQAPCSVSFTDSPNVIRLHAGKMVGICESESSKGFMVRTPHMDVTDLGTRFGVDASLTDSTEVHVYSGIVELLPSDQANDTKPSNATPSRLVQGQAARISRGSDKIERLPADSSRFDLVPARITRYKGSGVGLNAGEPDPRWTVLEADGKTLDLPVVLRVLKSNSTHGVRNDPQRAQWVSWNPGLPPNDRGFNLYRFKTTIKLPTDFDPATDQLLLDYAADSGINQIAVNGRVTHDFSNPGTLNGDKTRRVVFSDGLTPGNNTFQFIVRNSTRRQVGPSNAVGIWADWQLHQSQ